MSPARPLHAGERRTTDDETAPTRSARGLAGGAAATNDRGIQAIVRWACRYRRNLVPRGARVWAAAGELYWPGENSSPAHPDCYRHQYCPRGGMDLGYTADNDPPIALYAIGRHHDLSEPPSENKPAVSQKPQPPRHLHRLSVVVEQSRAPIRRAAAPTGAVIGATR